MITLKSFLAHPKVAQEIPGERRQAKSTSKSTFISLKEFSQGMT